MQNVEQTIASQFANSPTLVQLIQDMNAYIDPSQDLDNFYNAIWNIDTAVGFGLDIWGRIVNIKRSLVVPALNQFLGFKEALSPPPPPINQPQPWGQAPWYSRANQAAPSVLTLADEPYRTLILCKAICNISDCSIPSLNQLLTNLFAGRGQIYVADLGSMQMEFVCNFHLHPFEVAILTTSEAIPKPAGVSVSISAP